MTHSGYPIPGLHWDDLDRQERDRTGEFGFFGSIISQVTDAVGNTVVHRETIFEETFAKYAYFSNSENGLYFGGGDQIFGPTHSNDNLRIAPSGVEFHNLVTTSQIDQHGPAVRIFDQGYKQTTPAITLPTVPL